MWILKERHGNKHIDAVKKAVQMEDAEILLIATAIEYAHVIVSLK